MKGTLLFLLIGIMYVLGLTGCKHTERQYYPDGKLMQESEYKGKKLDGKTLIYYGTGPVMQELYYEDGIINGKVTTWFTDGKMRSEEMYAKGKKNGVGRYWDENGNLFEQKTFADDSLHGNYKCWFEDGTLKIEGWYDNGQFDSTWTYYSINSLKVGEGRFVDGKGLLTGYNVLGRKIVETEYSNSKKNGREITYDQAGNVVNILEYANDKIVVSR